MMITDVFVLGASTPAMLTIRVTTRGTLATVSVTGRLVDLGLGDHRPDRVEDDERAHPATDRVLDEIGHLLGVGRDDVVQAGQVDTECLRPLQVQATLHVDVGTPLVGLVALYVSNRDERERGLTAVLGSPQLDHPSVDVATDDQSAVEHQRSRRADRVRLGSLWDVEAPRSVRLGHLFLELGPCSFSLRQRHTIPPGRRSGGTCDRRGRAVP